MKIGIISDTHDNSDNVKAALERIHADGITKILHCGDVCGPDLIQAFAGFDIWIAQGNMDRHAGLDQVAHETLGDGRLAWLQKLVLDGYQVAMVHGDNEEVLSNLCTCGEYAYVFHGHTHRRRDQKIGRTRVINPGALGGTRRERYSFCILDLETGRARFVKL